MLRTVFETAALTIIVSDRASLTFAGEGGEAGGRGEIQYFLVRFGKGF